MRAALVAVAALVAAVPAGAAGQPVTGIAGPDPLSGKPVSLDHWRGRPVAINVWASWCEGCKEEAKALKRFEQAHPNGVLGIDYQDTRAGARAFYARYDLDHPSISDPAGKLVGRLKAIGLPTTVFLDKRHVAVYAIAGAATLDQLNEGWRRATRGWKPPTATRR
jgi:cytochrome c biogenesis protein CcmG/thiol:disulfide interchange protein DsbE